MAATSPPSLKLILASASPRRLGLLAQIGVVPDLVSPIDFDESLRRDETPRAAVERLARGKAEAAVALRRSGDDLILTADTIVACGRRVLGKPADEQEARRMLELLSGRRHQVLSAICLVGLDGAITCRTVVTRVSFKRLSTEELRVYLECGEWKGKAGAYAIQGRAGIFVRGLEGSYSNVVGLPLYETANLLTGAGYRVAEGWAT